MPTPLRPTKTWPQERMDELQRLWKAGESMAEIARALGTTRNAIIWKSNRLNLQFHGGPSRPLSPTAPAVQYATTRFPTRVKAPPRSGVLKPGSYQRKLGSIVTKGAWKGLPIFSLTLEERATCPRSCKMWLGCYGNNMGQSIRYAANRSLVDAIYADLVMLERRNPKGFVVRLHILGDFFSVEYVQFWRDMLDEFPGLRVFGYTARSSGNKDLIGWAIEQLRDERWDRFAVRTSGAVMGPRTKVVTREYPDDGSIMCPAQTGKTDCCATCALCWAPAAKNTTIAFKAH